MLFCHRIPTSLYVTGILLHDYETKYVTALCCIEYLHFAMFIQDIKWLNGFEI